jgi:hypothetical protein
VRTDDDLERTWRTRLRCSEVPFDRIPRSWNVEADDLVGKMIGC